MVQQPSNQASEKEVTDKREYYKYSSEYFRHLTTLSTAAILWITTFWDKLGKTATSSGLKWLLAVALGCFMASLFSTTYNLKLHIRDFPKKEAPSPDEHFRSGVAMFAAWVGFTIGLLALTCFGIVSLLCATSP